MASAYVQKAWFITLECGQQSISFPALLIRNQRVIENLEQNRPQSRKIETVTSFGVAQRDCFFQDAPACIGLPLYHIGMCATFRNIPGLLIKDQSSIEKF